MVRQLCMRLVPQLTTFHSSKQMTRLGVGNFLLTSCIILSLQVHNAMPLFSLPKGKGKKGADIERTITIYHFQDGPYQFG